MATSKGKRLKELRKGLPENFCPVPFFNMILNADGSACVCRYHSRIESIGHVSENSLEELWNNEKIRSWRREFLSGKVSICKQNIETRKCHLQMVNNEMIPHIRLDEYQDFPMLQLTANINGHCNLECPMCDVWTFPNKYFGDGFFNNSQDTIFPYLKKIDFYSGEPFIQKETYRLIDEISAVNPDCSWQFTTNGHWKLTEKIKSALLKIKVESITVSIDSLNPDTYSQIRKKGDLSVVLKTVQDLKHFLWEEHPEKDNLNYEINMTVQKLNWQEIPSFIRFAQREGIYPSIWPLFIPKDLSVMELSEKEKYRILDFLLNQLKTNEVALAREFLGAFIDSLPKSNMKKKYYWTYLNMLANSSSQI